MQPKLVRDVPAGSLWRHEIQTGGLRCLLRRDGASVRVWFPDSEPVACPAVIEAAKRLPADAVIDGDLVVLSPEGRPQAQALFTRAGARRAVLMASDLLMVDGRDIRDLPFGQRRTRLAALLADADAIELAEAFVDGRGLLADAAGEGMPGILSRRVDAPYTEGVSAYCVAIPVGSAPASRRVSRA
jgi:bifunctional non-homologous end joining protein LigD